MDSGLPARRCLPQREQAIDEYESSGNLCPKQLVAVVGCILAALGLVLLFNTIDKVHYNARSNVNLCVLGFFCALGTFLLGGWMLLCGLGLAPF
jgi:hypothetical protein